MSTTGQSSNMSNTLLNSVPTLNSSNGVEWLPAMEAYLMSQGLWTAVSEKHPVDPRATVLARLAHDTTDAARQAAIAGVDVAAQTAAED